MSERIPDPGLTREEAEALLIARQRQSREWHQTRRRANDKLRAALSLPTPTERAIIQGRAAKCKHEWLGDGTAFRCEKCGEWKPDREARGS